MSFYWIRHAPQTHFGSDASIKPLNPRALHHFRQLPIPDKMIVSPYLRTRQTAEVLEDTLNSRIKGGWQGSIEIEPLLGEFCDYPLDPSTLEWSGRRIPGAGSRNRSQRNPAYQQWVEGLEEAWEDISQETGVIWIVTHALVLKWRDEQILGDPRFPRGRDYQHLSILSEEGEYRCGRK